MPYANGGLFENPTRLHLQTDELELLHEAAGFDWRDVQPQIFGSLLEGTLGHDKQWELGAHYTHDAELQKIILPTIVMPWTERVENLATHREAERAQTDLMNYVVLDPACGSGNFLYLAYRELRRIERRLHEREAELRQTAGMADAARLNIFFPLQNIRGIEIDTFAVSLARVTLWMAHRLAVEELQLNETTLPLADLSGIVNGDALRSPWPRLMRSSPTLHTTALRTCARSLATSGSNGSTTTSTAACKTSPSTGSGGQPSRWDREQEPASSLPTP